MLRRRKLLENGAESPVSGARFVIRMKLNWGLAGAILWVIMPSGAHRGRERLGQPSAALGCPGRKDKPVVLFGGPADF